MAIKIEFHGAIIEVSDPQELATVLTVIRNTQGTNVSKLGTGRLTLSEFWNKISKGADKAPKRHEALKALAERPDSGLTDTELRERLDLANNNALAGMFAGLSKMASKSGLDFSDLVVSTREPTQDGKVGYRYRLTKEMIKVVSKS